MPERNVLDILVNVEHLTNFTKHFGPASYSEPKIERAAERYILVKFQQRYVMSHRNLPGLRGFASDPDGLNRILVGLIDRLQRQMLVDLQALFAFVPGNQLNLGVGEAFGRQEGQHLMAEQMRV